MSGNYVEQLDKLAEKLVDSAVSAKLRQAQDFVNDIPTVLEAAEATQRELEMFAEWMAENIEIDRETGRQMIPAEAFISEVAAGMELPRAMIEERIRIAREKRNPADPGKE